MKERERERERRERERKRKKEKERKERKRGERQGGRERVRERERTVLIVSSLTTIDDVINLSLFLTVLIFTIMKLKVRHSTRTTLHAFTAETVTPRNEENAKR